MLVMAGWDIKTRVFHEEDVVRDALGQFASGPSGRGSTGRGAGTRRAPAKKPAAGRATAKASAATKKAVARIQGALPRTSGAWKAQRGKMLPRERHVDRRLRELETELATVNAILKTADDNLLAEFRRKRVPVARRAAIREQRLDKELRDVRYAENAVTAMRDYANDPDLATRQDSMAPHLVRMRDPEFLPEYPVDANGTRIPPEQYERHLDGVLEAGRLLRDDWVAATDKDPTLKAMEDRLNGDLGFAAIDRETNHMEQLLLQRQRRQLLREKRMREQELLLQVLGSVRKVGGIHHVGAVPGTREDTTRVNRWTGRMRDVDQKARAPRSDWRGRLREGESFFPEDWLRESATEQLVMMSAHRAFHYKLERGSVLAMPTAANDRSVYDGAFRDDTAETVVHELGHRMEDMIPGLRELEFTYVRRRARQADGSIERTQRLDAIFPGYGYKSTEVALPDMWADAYAGKTYETTDPRARPDSLDPASKSWEVFTTGLQDLLGRSTRNFGGVELQAFTLGVLATLFTPPKPEGN